MIKILVVDDVDYIRKSICKVLETNGFECTASENGKLAIDMIENGEFDLLITDLMMPEVDGYELVDHIRAMKGGKSQMPILAISGGSKTINSDVALQTLADQVDRVLQKPFAKNDLLEAVTKVLGNAKHKSMRG